MDKIGYYVKFRARTGQRDALVKILLQAAELTQDAPGCELYIVNTTPSEDDVVWVTEIWSSAADHTASLSAPGAKELIGQALPLLAGPPERIDLHPTGGVGLHT
ncbi:putative quinol monooxygenase [Actinacidiphila guanduensis]|uniref:Quinol monooxygenase YgiN n=1 Tax=Actinacidiphila guanduensis TaxID=310781 RepID=A0A1H0FGT6_9ACTN|nr:putative quinol monooxygenase [Actinacidiphila guanduensis]SDN93742.1 Quinol monooxygenase YgiN [Actinacidiphila guanduensis]